MAKNAKKHASKKTPSSQVMTFLEKLRDRPDDKSDAKDDKAILAAARDLGIHDQATLAAALDLDPGHLSRILSGKTPVGPAVIGRSVVYLPSDAANFLIAAYLDDEVAQIETHRQRVAKKESKPADGRFRAAITVTMAG